MRVIVKVLKGEDCCLEVDEHTTIASLKAEIETKLKIPKANQKLLLGGRTLSPEDATLKAFPKIQDGTKLNLVVMQANTQNRLRDIIKAKFRVYYNDHQSEQLCALFMENFEKKIKQMSTDDIERLSSSLI